MLTRKNYKRALISLASGSGRHATSFPAEILEPRCLLSVTITTLAAFNAVTGSTPTGSIAIDAAGDLFGTTEGTYPKDAGVIWELKKTGTKYAPIPTVLATFPVNGDFGQQPKGGVSIDSNGNLFGTTYNGYLTDVNGTFWELPKTQSGYGSLQLRQGFNGSNGQNPSGQLFIDSNNNVFGTAVGNSARGIASTIWEYSSAGVFTVLASIDGSNPYIIQGTPVLDSAGNLYESTVDKGTGASGTILKLAYSQSGGFSTTATTLASFDGTNGVTPSGQLSIDAAGNLFGTSRGNGGANLGTVWEIAADNGIPGNIISVVGSFNSAGTTPIGGTLLSNGDLFGTTSSGIGNSSAGTFWTISPASTGSLTTLATFSAASNGSSPVSNVVTDGNGNYFSTAQNGGAGSRGTIVEFKGPNGNSSGATHLSIEQQPGTSVAGHALGPFLTVHVLDAKNQPVLTDHSTITVSVNDTNGGLTGTLQLQVNNGFVTFGDLELTKVGSYQLTVTDGVLKSDQTSPFSITPDLNTTHLVLIQQPADTVVGTALTPIVFHIEDQYHNFVPTQPNNPNPTLTIIAGDSNGTLSGATTVAAKKGVITFTKLIFNTAGSYTLSFSDPATLSDPTPVQFVQTITQGITTVVAPHPSKSYTFGQTINLSTTFKSTAPASVPFTGNATIMDQSNNVLGTVALTAKGLAKFALTGIAPGTYTCTVNYAGDANHTAATSSSFTLLIKTAPTKITLKPNSTHVNNTTTLTLTATALSTGGVATPLTGSVIFSEGANPIGTITLNAGIAVLIVPTPTIGKHKYTAKYQGDTNFASSNSTTITVNVSG